MSSSRTNYKQTPTERLALVFNGMPSHFDIAPKDLTEYLKQHKDNLPKGLDLVNLSVREVDPDAPKKTKSGYQFYVSHVRPGLKESGVKPSEVFIKAAEQWKALSEEGKAPFQALSDKDKVRYETEKAEYTGGVVGLKQPTRTTGWVLFMQTRKPELSEEQPGLNIAELTSLLADEWDAIKEDEDLHKMWNDKAAKKNQGHEKRMEEYYEAGGVKKSLSPKQQEKAGQPDLYELNEKTGNYVLKKVSKAKATETEDEKPKTKKVAAVSEKKKKKQVVEELE